MVGCHFIFLKTFIKQIFLPVLWNVQVEDGKRNARWDGSGKEKDLNVLRRKESREEGNDCSICRLD